MLASFHGLAVCVEPPLLRAAERVGARWVLGAALAGIAAVALGASFAGSQIALLVLLALYGPLSGLALSAAEGALVESAPEARERTLARLTLAGALGDLAVPAAIAAIGWRGSFRTAALIALALALALACARSLGRRVATSDDEEDGEPPRLRDALRHRPLVAWCAAAALTNLVDELALALFAVHAHVHLPLGWIAIALGAWTAGGIAGVALLERALDRLAPIRLLGASAAIALVALACVIVLREPIAVCASAFVLGASAACFHPIVAARTYASMPGHPGVVNAIGSLFTAPEIGVTLAFGVLADTLGASAALAALAVVPIGMLGISVRVRR
jgi:predicted MFS family arabinose efflux permease